MSMYNEDEPVIERVEARDLHIGDWVHHVSGEQMRVTGLSVGHDAAVVRFAHGAHSEIVPLDYKYRVEVEA